MAIKNLLVELQNALSIAQAGIKGTLKSLKKTVPQAEKLAAGKRTPNKKVHDGGLKKPKTKPKPKPKPKLHGRNPDNLVRVSRAVVPRKPSKQKPARKSKKLDRP